MNSIKYKFSYFILIVFITLTACNTNNIDKENPNSESIIKLAITKAHGSSGYLQYKKWIKHHDSTIIIYDLYELPYDSAAKILAIVDGLIISGGPDVNPKLYNEDSLSYICETPDNYRDSLEFQSIRLAYNRKLPILGICRGQQILNVFFGGSLIADIPTKHGTEVIHRTDTGAYHQIIININNPAPISSLHDTIIVNSYHHQAINRIAKQFNVLATSKDGIIEAIYLKNETNYPTFFLGVQFHPEHMIDTQISKNIAESFIHSLKKQSLK